MLSTHSTFPNALGGRKKRGSLETARSAVFVGVSCFGHGRGLDNRPAASDVDQLFSEPPERVLVG